MHVIIVAVVTTGILANSDLKVVRLLNMTDTLFAVQSEFPELLRTLIADHDEASDDWFRYDPATRGRVSLKDGKILVVLDQMILDKSGVSDIHLLLFKPNGKPVDRVVLRVNTRYGRLAFDPPPPGDERRSIKILFVPYYQSKVTGPVRITRRNGEVEFGRIELKKDELYRDKVICELMIVDSKFTFLYPDLKLGAVPKQLLQFYQCGTAALGCLAPRQPRAAVPHKIWSITNCKSCFGTAPNSRSATWF